MTEIVTRLEELLEKPPEGTYVLRLYVTGATTRSAHAVENVRKICDASYDRSEDEEVGRGRPSENITIKSVTKL